MDAQSQPFVLRGGLLVDGSGSTAHVADLLVRDGRIEANRWYRIRARCQGRRIQAWLDDDLVIDYTDDGKGPSRGRAGVGTWITQAQFRNFKVTSLDGKTLYDGLPSIPDAGQDAAPGWRSIGLAKASTATDNPLI